MIVFIFLDEEIKFPELGGIVLNPGDGRWRSLKNGTLFSKIAHSASRQLNRIRLSFHFQRHSLLSWQEVPTIPPLLGKREMVKKKRIKRKVKRRKRERETNSQGPYSLTLPLGSPSLLPVSTSAYSTHLLGGNFFLLILVVVGCWVPLCSISSRVILFPLSRQLHRLANISRNEWKRITTTKVFNNTKIKNRAIIHFSYKTRFHLTRLLMMMKLASFLLRPCWIGKNTVCCCVWINCLSRRLCVHILENMDGRISTLKGFIFFNCLFFFCWVFPYAAGKVPIPGSFSPFYLLLLFFFFLLSFGWETCFVAFLPNKNVYS